MFALQLSNMCVFVQHIFAAANLLLIADTSYMFVLQLTSCCVHFCLQGRHRTKLWAKIEEILDKKESSAGLVQFKLKLLGIEKPVWVVSGNLSQGVASNYKNDLGLARNAKAKVDRVVAEEQKEFMQQSPASKETKKKQLKSLDPLKVASKFGKYISLSQMYHHAINKILATKISERKSVREKVLQQLPHLSDYVVSNLKVDNFFSGQLVPWTNETPVFEVAKDQSGAMRCTVCEKTFHFAGLSRALYHVTCKAHHQCCKKKKQKSTSASSAAVLQEQMQTTLGTHEVSCMIYI